jgi:hypothetical protein
MDINLGIAEDAEKHESMCDFGHDLNVNRSGSDSETDL